MAKVGDTVRFLNTTGGGIIRRIDGNIAYVEEDGFETPVLIKEVVVVLPAGHQPKQSGAALMFDQSAYDNGKKAPVAERQPQAVSKDVTPAPNPEPIVETEYGDKISISLAFEPSDLKRLSASHFNAVLVNDSNYQLDFIFAGKAAEEHDWKVIYHGTVLPNELIDLAQFDHEHLGAIERVAIQALPYRTDKRFGLKSPIDATRKIDLTKFHKLHCFRPGKYFDEPVLEFPILTDDALPQSALASTPVMRDHLDAMDAYDASLEALKGKFHGKEGDAKRVKKSVNPADNPHKLLPLIEVDLHIGELTDTTAGMSNGDMLELQLDTVRRTMKAHRQRKGQKIVFIHGKGEGVLRKAVLQLLKKEYPTAELQDASFREYGFGATLVTVK